MVKTQFGIKDLENLSNVKAHTIRIWEKRYNLLEPDRTDTNIRKYDLENLKKLLNIAYLYNAGHKISKLASLSAVQIQELIKSNIQGLDSEYMLNVFKSSMFGFNSELFDTTLAKMLEQKTFREVFTEIFIPLLNDVGVLWHTGTIDPAHEHFISEKIKHAIIHQSNYKNKALQKSTSPTFVLYLPLQEIHEIGLLYANYELVSMGYNTLYLGANIPMESLRHIISTTKDTTFVTFFTVQPENNDLDQYLIDFQNTICKKTACELWILGRKAKTEIKNTKSFKFFKEVNLFIDCLKKLNEA
ncbi:MerR family transcriptional regulator [Aequorivita sp. Q41]|uniref:MerR family transcriptional regulator n=1 Tax=Aequorivita sp. Q41 TaxID=3153300 RepID=UPI003242F53F